MDGDRGVPERIDIKTEVFGELDRLAEPDVILCSNSSSIPTSQMIGKVEHPERVLNTHYQQPPELNAVELMSCGKTEEGVIEALMEKLPHYGLVPFWVRRESDGFIFNRIWAAIKRECLMVVEEGVAPPEDVDAMWEIFTRAGVPLGSWTRRPGRRAGHRGALRCRARGHPGRSPQAPARVHQPGASRHQERTRVLRLSQLM